MKKYFTVKEAANLLSVSTNTIYAYLESGKLVSRRIGKGRFKIPYSQLAPFIDSEAQPQFETPAPVQMVQSVVPVQNSKPIITTAPVSKEEIFITPEQQVQVMPEKESVVSFAPGQPSGDEDFIVPLKNDKIIWRLFKGLSFLGLGIIYSFTSKLTFNLTGSFLQESAEIFNFLLPFGLILTGIITLIDVFNERKVKEYDTLIHLVSAIVLSYYSFLSVPGKEYGTLIFAGSFATLIVLHIIRGVTHEGTFFESFTKYIALVSVIGGTLLVIDPSFLPFFGLNTFATVHRGIFGVFWFGLITVPSLYFLSSVGKKSVRLFVSFYLVISVAAFIIATELTIKQRWDIAYISYLLGVFGLFLVWWSSSKFRISVYRFNNFSISFIWVAIVILIGLFFVSTTSEDLKKQKDDISLANIDRIAHVVRNKLDSTSSLITGYAGDPQTSSIIESGDTEVVIAKAKEIYDKSDVAHRVLIYNSSGIAVGVYPRTSIAQGTDFSSRNYFRDTKSSLKGVVSEVFTTVTDSKAIMVTEPIFKDNSFYGMIGLSIDLEKMSLLVQNDIGKDNFIYITDTQGVYAFGSNLKDIGRKKDELSYLNIDNNQNISNSPKVYTYNLVNPNWKFYLQTPQPAFGSDVSYLNILLTVLIVVNSAFSIFAGIATSFKKKPTEVGTVPESQNVVNPQVSLGGA